jgi:Domain of unknown function (DUF2703)
MATSSTSPDRMRIELLFLDLTACTRCRGADRSLEEALDLVREFLTATGVEVEVDRIHVESAAQARKLRFQSSPTIRVNGADIALELRESPCGSEACADGCNEQIDCRVWVHRGEEYTEPPVAMIIDAILREVYAGEVVEREVGARPYELPENLERFFAGRPTMETCCSPAEQRDCCVAEDKADCCGTSARDGCGCQ